MQKRIAVFTSIRSEYGLLFPFLKALRSCSDFDLKLLVGGAHLLQEFGQTIDQIRLDGFHPDCEFPFLTDGNDPPARAMARLQTQITDYLETNRPDFFLVLGDRFELLPVVSTALVMDIPIAHISGGEVTEGVIDNQVRHAVSKMAHLHFVANETYRKNLLKMGEEDWRICVSGELALDEILSLEAIPKKDLFKELGIDPDLPVICSTFHPETIDNQITAAFVRDVLLKISKNFQVVVTAANFDSQGQKINAVLEELSSQHKNIVYRKSLGQKRYYSLLHYCAAMVGNSSSGVVEAQSFSLPVVNVGKRQLGRLQNKNVINCEAEAVSILKSLDLAMGAEHKRSFKAQPNIYGSGNSATSILKFLQKNISRPLLLKRSIFE